VYSEVHNSSTHKDLQGN